MDVPGQEEKREKYSSFLLFLLYLCPQQKMLTHSGERGSSLLSLLNRMLTSSRNTFTEIPKNMFYQLSGHALAQSN